MILSRNMLKRVGESGHPCWTPTVVRNQSSVLLLKRTALAAFSKRFLMTRIRLAQRLYFFMVAHKLMPNPVKIYENKVEILLVLEIFLT